VGPLPVLQTLRDKEPFYWLAGFRRNGWLSPGPGVGAGWRGFPVPTLRYL